MDSSTNIFWSTFIEDLVCPSPASTFCSGQSTKIFYYICVKPFSYNLSLEDIYQRMKDIEALVNESKIDEVLSDNFFLNSSSVWLFESIEQIEKGKQTEHGEEDVYEIVLKNKQKFFIRINFVSPSYTKQQVVSNQMNTAKYDNTISDNYKKHFADLKDNEQIAYIMFVDESSGTKLTGTTGVYSVELFRGIEQAVNQSFYGKTNLRGFIIRVDNSESKRLKLYKRIIETMYKNFPNVFTDNISEKNNNTTLLIATK